MSLMATPEAYLGGKAEIAHKNTVGRGGDWATKRTTWGLQKARTGGNLSNIKGTSGRGNGRETGRGCVSSVVFLVVARLKFYIRVV